MSDSKRIKLDFNVVYHPLRKKIGTDPNGFVLLDAVYHYSYNHINQTGWCYASKETLADIVGVSRATAFRYINNFVQSGWLDRQDGTGYLRTTSKFNHLLEEHRGRFEISQPAHATKTIPSQNDTIRLNPPPSQNDTTPSQNDTRNRIKMRRNKYSNKNNNKNKDKKSDDTNLSHVLINEFDNSLSAAKEQVSDFQPVERKKTKTDYRLSADRFYENQDESSGIYWGWRAFEKLWTLAGKRGSKRGAWIAFHVLARIESAEDFEQQKPFLGRVAKHISDMQQTRQWREGFIPNFTTYINQRRWEGDVPKERRIGEPDNFKDTELAQKSRDRIAELRARSMPKKS